MFDRIQKEVRENEKEISGKERVITDQQIRIFERTIKEKII